MPKTKHYFKMWTREIKADLTSYSIITKCRDGQILTNTNHNNDETIPNETIDDHWAHTTRETISRIYDSMLYQTLWNLAFHQLGRKPNDIGRLCQGYHSLHYVISDLFYRYISPFL